MEPARPITKNLIETILLVLLFLGLLYALYQVLEVFFGVLTFALVFAVSFSGAYEKLVSLFHGKRKTAGLIYSALLTVIIALPFSYLVSTMVRHVKDLAAWLAVVQKDGLPPLSDRITGLPLLGSPIESFWSQLQESPKEVVHLHQHELNVILHHLLTGGLGVAGVALQLMLGIIFSAFLLERGNLVLLPIKESLGHLLNKQDGANLLEAITQAVRGVSIGVMGTAFILGFVCWTGLLLAGVPFATPLAAAVFFLSVIQVGPLALWVPLTIWQYVEGHNGAVLILVIYTLIILAIDFIIKPILIARSGQLPFLVLFIGVIGGLAAWGFTGMFKGAIITSVFYTIFTAWLERKRSVNAG